MDLLFWMGRVYARFVGVTVTLLSIWTFVANLSNEQRWGTWVLVWVLLSGLAGMAGGSVYLLSLDGPARFRARAFRTPSWTGMLVAMLLPTTLSIMLVPMVLTLIPSLFLYDEIADQPEEMATSP